MIIKINSRSEMPIYLQLRNQIVKGIGKGELEQGEIRERYYLQCVRWRRIWE